MKHITEYRQMPNRTDDALLVEQGKKYSRAFTEALNAVKCGEFQLARELVKDNPGSDRRVIENRIERKLREGQ